MCEVTGTLEKLQNVCVMNGGSLKRKRSGDEKKKEERIYEESQKVNGGGLKDLFKLTPFRSK